MTTLIMTAKLSDIDPLAWLADVLARIADLPQSQLHECLHPAKAALRRGVDVALVGDCSSPLELGLGLCLGMVFHADIR